MLEWAEKAFKIPFQLTETSLAEFAVLKSVNNNPVISSNAIIQ
ncbi:hypothetical protein ACEQPO_04650 [Bacillus sp. SL00103]